MKPSAKVTVFSLMPVTWPARVVPEILSLFLLPIKVQPDSSTVNASAAQTALNVLPFICFPLSVCHSSAYADGK